MCTKEVARALALGGVMAGRREEWGPPVPQRPRYERFKGERTTNIPWTWSFRHPPAVVVKAERSRSADVSCPAVRAERSAEHEPTPFAV